jgi:molybdenum cofactor cytidylyltransferase
MSARESGNVAGVVLAAGSSRRMGRNKLLLELGGESVVRRATRAASAAGLDPVLVVLGHEAGRVREELSGLACRAVLNPDHAEGAGASIRVAIAALPPAVAAIVVTLADMPFVTAPMIRALVERYRAGHATVVVSRYGDVEAPPTLFDRLLFGELLSIEGDRGARQVARRHRDEELAVTWPAEDLCDLDVAADYERARRHLAQR